MRGDSSTSIFFLFFFCRSENDVEIKDEDSNLDDAEEDEETPHQRHRVVNTEEESSSPKSRFLSLTVYSLKNQETYVPNFHLCATVTLS